MFPSRNANDKATKITAIVTALTALSVGVFFAHPQTAHAAQTEEGLLCISTAEELFAFSESVNSGKNYKNVTVRLTADIDLKGEPFTPIGIFGTEYIFKGTFDGDGHTIEGLSVLDETFTENNGLFGQLGGSVLNLTVAGELSGNCVGGIASHTAGSAQIINCASFVTVEANRGGGIADNLNTGDIIACYSRATNRRDEAITLVSYTANQVLYSASSGYLTGMHEGVTQRIRDCLERMDTTPLDDWYNEKVKLLWQSGYTGLRTWVDGKPAGEIYSEEISFEGKGTRRNPYLIRSVEDLALFRNGVNAGNAFRGKYFLQTSDLDCSALNPLPIGFADSDYSFDGVYDGGGHAIFGYTSITKGHSGKNAFFGNLSGTVKNLALRSGRIEGDIVASFAITAYSRKATVVNCYSELDLVGNTRASGLTDNFIGLVVGCSYRNRTCDVPLAAYNTTVLAYCASSGSTVIEEGTSEFDPVECVLLPYDAFYSESFALRHNDALPYVAQTSGVKLTTLYTLTETGFGEKATLPSFLTLLSVYRYEFLAVGAISLGVVLVIYCRKGEEA